MNAKKDLDKVLPGKIPGSPSLDVIFQHGICDGRDKFSRSPCEAHEEMKSTIAKAGKPPFSRG
jgi:hypothetical protein